MKRYVVCGVSNRAKKMYIGPLLTTFRQQGALVGLLDPDPRRFDVLHEEWPDTQAIPQYGAHDFDRMVRETQPEVVIVAGVDATHVDYIVPALAHHLQVITEKPMAASASDCRRILRASAQDPGQVVVAFNYRYASIHTEIKTLIHQGLLGRITSIEVTWLIDTYHGASYFKRWNRDRRLSGGLSVHKSSHHFDLMSWWLEQEPVEVFGYGALNYYGQDAEFNPLRGGGRHCSTCAVRDACAYYRRWIPRGTDETPDDDHLQAFGGRHLRDYSDYRPDACIFDPEIAIEDTYVGTIRYAGGAMASYSVNFSAPYEGYRIAVNGTRGRLETQYYHPQRTFFPVPQQTIEWLPLFGAKGSWVPIIRSGGHEGGDPALLEDLFLGPAARPFSMVSDARAGALAVATGEALWRSVQSGQPVRIKDLLYEGV